MKQFLVALLFFSSAGFAADKESSVTLHLLDHTDKVAAKEKFWIDWNNSWRGIVQTKTVTGKEADAVIALLKNSLKPDEQTNFCGHDPIYGVIATTAEGKQLKTSLCFKCVTWVQPKKRLVIAGQHGPDNPLAIELRKMIELPKELLQKKKN
ncbi:MAG: hypothetical protein HKN23_18640 [Verrucomicrobiales bacterium]|nr:hypothetical protein [Verrucomicrobiales bacterium]